MSKRRRNQARQTAEATQIEWLKHRAGYPSPDEREKIIQLREKLAFEVVKLAVLGVPPDDPRYRKLVQKYGVEEVLRANKKFSEGMDMPSRVADDARSFRDYRLRYARFGAGLKFYTSKEMEELQFEHAREMKGFFEGHGTAKTEKQSEIEKLLLVGWRDWDDITPPAIPPRPADYGAPPPAPYPAPISELLEWGSDLMTHHEFADEKEFLHWKKFIPALTRMALDPELLNGWPSDNASWAPWHAIHLLGNLQAWESAPALAELADFENDWLSDHLPHIWADMGGEAEPVLWMILESHSGSAKRRGLAAEALYMMTDDNQAMQTKVARGFEKILRNTKTFDPALNGYIIAFLREMDEIEELHPVIDEAFEQNRVDLNIISPEDLEEYGFEDDVFDEEDFDNDEFDDDEEDE